MWKIYAQSVSCFSSDAFRNDGNGADFVVLSVGHTRVCTPNANSNRRREYIQTCKESKRRSKLFMAACAWNGFASARMYTSKMLTIILFTFFYLYRSENRVPFERSAPGGWKRLHTATAPWPTTAVGQTIISLSEKKKENTRIYYLREGKKKRIVFNLMMVEKSSHWNIFEILWTLQNSPCNAA